MGEGNLVVFKGTADGIIVVLDELAPFEQIKTQLENKLNDSKQFFKGTKLSVRFKGRPLNNMEQEELIKLLSKQNIINISFVHQFENEEKKIDRDYLWLKEQLAHYNGSLTYFHYGIVRSGCHIDSPGNVIVLGDINPGGLVTAGGNVIVLGSVKGKIHAGLDTAVAHPFIISEVMAPIQIGIGNIIAQAPASDNEDYQNNQLQIAYTEDEHIYVDILYTKGVQQMLKSNLKRRV